MSTVFPIEQAVAELFEQLKPVDERLHLKLEYNIPEEPSKTRRVYQAGFLHVRDQEDSSYDKPEVFSTSSPFFLKGTLTRWPSLTSFNNRPDYLCLDLYFGTTFAYGEEEIRPGHQQIQFRHYGFEHAGEWHARTGRESPSKGKLIHDPQGALIEPEVFMNPDLRNLLERKESPIRLGIGYDHLRTARDLYSIYCWHLAPRDAGNYAKIPQAPVQEHSPTNDSRLVANL